MPCPGRAGTGTAPRAGPPSVAPPMFPAVKSAARPIATIRNPQVPRIVLQLEQLGCVEPRHPPALARLAGQLEEDLLERRALDRELVQDDAVGGGDLADPFRRSGAVIAVRRRRSVASISFIRRARCRSRGAIRRAHQRRPRRHRLDVGDRRLPHQPAAMDDHDLVDGLSNLREDVARDEDRAPLRRERAQKVAEPADALRIEAVRRLVEDEHLRVAEQRRGRARGADASRASSPSHGDDRPRPSSTSASTSSTRDLGMPPASARTRRWLRPERPGCASNVSRSAPTRFSGSVELAVRTAEDRRSSRRRPDEPEDRPASSSTSRRRSGRGSR